MYRVFQKSHTCLFIPFITGADQIWQQQQSRSENIDEVVSNRKLLFVFVVFIKTLHTGCFKNEARVFMNNYCFRKWIEPCFVLKTQGKRVGQAFEYIALPRTGTVDEIIAKLLRKSSQHQSSVPGRASVVSLDKKCEFSQRWEIGEGGGSELARRLFIFVARMITKHSIFLCIPAAYPPQILLTTRKTQSFLHEPKHTVPLPFFYWFHNKCRQFFNHFSNTYIYHLIVTRVLREVFTRVVV